MTPKPQFRDFQECHLAFVDILGFDERAKAINSELDFNKIADLLYVLREDAEHFTDMKQIDYTITSISDSIIISIPFHSQFSCWALFMYLHYLQYHLLFGFKELVRGYVAKGYVYHKNGYIFGSAYSDAFHKENELRGPPRILVDPQIVEYARKTATMHPVNRFSTVFEFLVSDSSNNYYIDYLKPVGTLTTVPKEKLIEERRQIRSFVEEKLIEYNNLPDNKDREKYLWLKEYYDNSEKYYAR